MCGLRKRKWFLNILVFLFILHWPCSARASWPATGNCGVCICAEKTILRIKSVDCSYRSLTYVPATLPSDLEQLDLSWNLINELKYNSLSPYTQLKILLLKNNLITQIPENVFDKTPLLEYLDLTDTVLTSVSQAAFSGLSNLNKLIGLSVKYLPVPLFTSLTSLKELGLKTDEMSLKQDTLKGLALEVLDLQLNEALSIPASLLSDLNSTLISLRITGNKLQSMDSALIRGLSQLSDLYIELSQITILSEDIFQYDTMHYQTRLKNITIVGVGQLLKNTFQYRPSLKVIRIRNVLDIHPEIFDGQLVWLSQLEMTHCNISQLEPKWFLNMDSLIDLDISWNSLTTVAPYRFVHMGFLETLNISHNEISSLSANSFQSSTDHWYNMLDLSWNKICSLPTGIFSKMTSLETLKLDHNCLTSPSILWFVDLSLLQSLHLNNNNITVINGTLLKTTPQVKFLNLSTNSIQRLPDDLLDYVPLLSVLDISNNFLTHLSGRLLANNSNLNQLFVSNNPLYCGCNITGLLQKMNDIGFSLFGTCANPKHLSSVELKDLTVNMVCNAYIPPFEDSTIGLSVISSKTPSGEEKPADGVTRTRIKKTALHKAIKDAEFWVWFSPLFSVVMLVIAGGSVAVIHRLRGWLYKRSYVINKV